MEFFESETRELISVYVEDIKKEIIAFANTRGGTIYIGVEDNGTVCGVDEPDEVIRQVVHATRDGIKPDLTLFMKVGAMKVGEKTIVFVQVQCGEHRPYYLGGKGLRPEGVYVRRGTSCIPASDTAIRQMIKETDGDNYEEIRSLEQTLTFEIMAKEFAKRNLLFEEAQKKTLKLTNNDGIYTNLGLLLSDQCPHIIKVATFCGVDQNNFQDRKEFGGSVLQQLEDAYAYLDMRNQTRATFEGLLRIDHRDYPDIAVREALLNAVIHRDYAVSASTLIAVYDDRIEILSVGGLAGGISFDDMMIGVSYCRNKNLANIFYHMKLIEAYGMGIRKMISAYPKDIQPEIKVTSGAFKVILPNLNYKK